MPSCVDSSDLLTRRKWGLNSTLDACNDDGCSLTPRDIHQYLGRVMYNRRNKFDPLWNELVVAGFRDGKPFLGAVDLIGTMYEDDVVATSFGYFGRALALIQPLQVSSCSPGDRLPSGHRVGFKHMVYLMPEVGWQVVRLPPASAEGRKRSFKGSGEKGPRGLPACSLLPQHKSLDPHTGFTHAPTKFSVLDNVGGTVSVARCCACLACNVPW
jgi:hypothetical protein